MDAKVEEGEEGVSHALFCNVDARNPRLRFMFSFRHPPTHTHTDTQAHLHSEVEVMERNLQSEARGFECA